MSHVAEPSDADLSPAQVVTIHTEGVSDVVSDVVSDAGKRAEEPELGGTGRVYKALRALLLIATTVASAVGAVLTVVLLAIGMSRIAWGVLCYAGLLDWEGEAEAESVGSATLEMCIRGLEFLFLAPMPFLIPVSLARYIRDSKEDRDDHKSKADLLSVKALTAALLIAVLASDLVGEALGPNGLHYEGAIAGSIVIVVLALYFFGLEWQARVETRRPE